MRKFDSTVNERQAANRARTAMAYLPYMTNPEITSRTRPRRRETPRAGSAPAVERSTRYRHLVNPFEPVRIFSEDQVESMHQAALGILERQGMRILSPRGRAALAAAGASVDETTHIVRMDAAMVRQALATRAGRDQSHRAQSRAFLPRRRSPRGVRTGVRTAERERSGARQALRHARRLSRLGAAVAGLRRDPRARPDGGTAGWLHRRTPPRHDACAADARGQGALLLLPRRWPAGGLLRDAAHRLRRR